MSGRLSAMVQRPGAMVVAAFLLIAASARDAQAHCDTMDGPVVAAARKALETGSLSSVLILGNDANR